MAESFDPYHKWLGIPPKDQPPNHYRLLGIDPFEPDPDVIDAAANRQMAYIQSCADGPHLALSQQLLNEVSAARVCLLDRRQKAQYDAALRRELSAAGPPPPANAPPVPSPPDAVAEPPAPQAFPVVNEDTFRFDDTIAPGETIIVDDTPAEPSGSQSGEYRLPSRRQSQQVYWIAAAAAGLVVLVMIVILLSTGGEDQPDPGSRKRLSLPPRTQRPPSTPKDPVPSPDPGILIDDNAVVTSWPGNKKRKPWIRRESVGATYQGDYYLTDDGRGRGDYVAVFPIPEDLEPGRYEVRVTYTHAAGRARNVSFVVHHANKTSTPPAVDQRKRPKIDQRFHKLGEFVFDGRQGEKVVVNNRGANGLVVIDAVQLVRVGDGGEPARTGPTKTAENAGKGKPGPEKKSKRKKGR